MVVRDECGAGHESAGDVIEVGEGVTSLVKGDRVAIECGVPCGLASCDACRTGRYNACESGSFRVVWGEGERGEGEGKEVRVGWRRRGGEDQRKGKKERLRYLKRLTTETAGRLRGSVPWLGEAINLWLGGSRPGLKGPFHGECLPWLAVVGSVCLGVS